MNKEKIEKILFIALIIAGIGYVYYNYLLQPQLEVIQQKNAQLTKIQAHYLQLSNYARNMAGLQQEIKAQEDQDKKLSSQLNNQINKPQVMVDLYSLAKTHGVTPQNIKFDALQDNGKYQQLGMLFSAQGNPADVLSMIQDLGTGNLKVSVQGVNLVMQQGYMRADIKLADYAGKTAIGDAGLVKPPFMNAKFGVDSIPHLFQQ